MKLEFTKLHHLSQLHDELLEAIPALRPVPVPAGELPPGRVSASRPVMTIEGSGNQIFLTVPDDVDEKEIHKVIKTHVPKPPPPAPPTRTELRDRLKKAKTTEEIKAVIESVLDRIPG